MPDDAGPPQPGEDASQPAVDNATQAGIARRLAKREFSAYFEFEELYAKYAAVVIRRLCQCNNDIPTIEDMVIAVLEAVEQQCVEAQEPATINLTRHIQQLAAERGVLCKRKGECSPD